MFMSVLDTSLTSANYTELADTRVVVTGVTASFGVDVTRAFADAGARLVLQTPACATDPETTELLAVLAEAATEIRVFDGALTSALEAGRFAQTGCQQLGGVDTMINLLRIQAPELDALAQSVDIERCIAALLQPLFQMAKVAANRMRLTLTEGSIVTVVQVERGSNARTDLVAAMVKAALAAMTRLEAGEWAAHGIRINAIGPRLSLGGETEAGSSASEPEIAAIALYLASSRSRGLSGHLFQAEGVLTTSVRPLCD